jgi:hypothetical protein
MSEQTGPPRKPWPPPDPAWPEHVKATYAARCERIDRLRQQLGMDGVVPLPFTCDFCDRPRCDFAMLTGDGLPLCGECFERSVDALCRGAGRSE